MLAGFVGRIYYSELNSMIPDVPPGKIGTSRFTFYMGELVNFTYFNSLRLIVYNILNN